MQIAHWPGWLASGYAAFEFALLLSRRSTNAARADRGSLRVLWVTIAASVTLAVFAAYWFPHARFSNSSIVTGVGVAIFAIGIAWRLYAIVYLGRFFTVDVAIAANQRVIDSGPYRLIRHPSYTGSLLVFLGIGLCMGNAVTLVLLLVPTTLALLHRIRIEEAALQAGLGEAYRLYMARTRRLIPYLY